MQRICTQCSATFEITDDDLAFYDKVSPVFNGKKELIPPPTHCPDCRLRRRLASRNNIYVYNVSSAQSGKEIFSRFPPNSRFPIVENEWWFGDNWDPMLFGKDVTFDQPIIAQLDALRNVVPHRTLSVSQCENSDYCNNNANLKNCYLIFNSSFSEDSLYCEQSVHTKDCIDCTYCPYCELCYDCSACTRCYNLQSSNYSEDCSNSHYLSFCRSCKDCFGCVNLRHKQYCVWNEQKTKEEYEAFMRMFQGSSWEQRVRFQEQFNVLALQHPRPHGILRQTENVDGNFIQNSRNVHDGFLIDDAEDIEHGFALYEGARDSRDYSYFGLHAELMYECVQCGIDVSHLLFCFDCWGNNSDLLYCVMCHGSSNCFGCVGLQKKHYCIFNKQYTKEEYEELVPRIIDHMRNTGEWGEYFPLSFSPIPYNHSVAQRHFPLTKTDIEVAGLSWYDRETEDRSSAVDARQLPDNLPQSDDSIVVRSQLSGRPFRITSREIQRYRLLAAPLPRMTYDERIEERMKLLGGIRLFDRTCAKTGTPIKTTIPPDSPWIVWDRDVWEQEYGS